MATTFYHLMVRVLDLDASKAFYEMLDFVEDRRRDDERGRYTNVFMRAEGDETAVLEMTYNWDGDAGLPSDSRHFGHIALIVDDIYAMCERLQAAGVVINRPPRDGHMAFVRSPDNVSVELLQRGDALPAKEPWASMENTGHW